MLKLLLDLIPIAKYLTIALGAIGLITIFLGIYRNKKDFIARGGYILVLSVTLLVCGYLIYKTTIKSIQNKLDNTYIQY